MTCSRGANVHGRLYTVCSTLMCISHLNCYPLFVSFRNIEMKKVVSLFYWQIIITLLLHYILLRCNIYQYTTTLQSHT